MTLPDALPVFPLPGMAWMPGTRLPLHIFEPRYRAMVERCIEEGSPLAVTGISPGFEDQQAADPPVRLVCTVGTIFRHFRLPDGRLNIILQGAQRVRLTRELPGRDGYRIFAVEPWPDLAEARADLGPTRALISAMAARTGQAGPALDELLNEEDPGLFSFRVGSLVLPEPLDRQAFIEERRPSARLATLEEHLAAALGEIAPSAEA